MTADVELLPLPCPWCAEEADTWWDGEGYCVQCSNSKCPVTVNTDSHATESKAITAWNRRANVAHATAAKDAEIEALRAEVDRMKDMAMMQAARAAAAERGSERLAEALRFARTRFAPYMDDTDRAAFDAALHPTAAQEDE